MTNRILFPVALAVAAIFVVAATLREQTEAAADVAATKVVSALPASIPGTSRDELRATVGTMTERLRAEEPALAEQLLEVDVADVAGIVVPGNDDDILAVEPVEVALGLGVLLLEAERRQVTGADDDLRLELVDLVDRAFGEIRDEVRRAAVEVGKVSDPEQRVPLRRRQ